MQSYNFEVYTPLHVKAKIVLFTPLHPLEILVTSYFADYMLHQTELHSLISLFYR